MVNWSRVVMNNATQTLVSSLDYKSFETLEISSSNSQWKSFGFKSYTSLDYPAFDICKDNIPSKFDLIIAEQVFEHLKYPYKAGLNVFNSLSETGYFLITTPFLVKVHNHPIDCTRWTELGLKYFLEEVGFKLNNIVTGSWGSKECVVANFNNWVTYDPAIHSLINEEHLPYHVWALATK